MRFAVLGSGSGGNAAVVEGSGLRLMIDAGLSAKQLSIRLKQVGVDPASLDGILITHEHGDHVRGLKVFLKQNPVPVFTTAATARVVRESGIEGGTWKCFEAGQVFEIGGIAVETFAIQHDAVDPVGFVLGASSQRLGAARCGGPGRLCAERIQPATGLPLRCGICDTQHDRATARAGGHLCGGKLR